MPWLLMKRNQPHLSLITKKSSRESCGSSKISIARKPTAWHSATRMRYSSGESSTRTLCRGRVAVKWREDLGSTRRRQLQQRKTRVMRVLGAIQAAHRRYHQVKRKKRVDSKTSFRETMFFKSKRSLMAHSRIP